MPGLAHGWRSATAGPFSLQRFGFVLSLARTGADCPGDFSMSCGWVGPLWGPGVHPLCWDSRTLSVSQLRPRLPRGVPVPVLDTAATVSAGAGSPGSAHRHPQPHAPASPRCREVPRCSAHVRRERVFTSRRLNCSAPPAQTPLSGRGRGISEMRHNLKKLDPVCPRLRIALN